MVQQQITEINNISRKQQGRDHKSIAGFFQADLAASAASSAASSS